MTIQRQIWLCKATTESATGITTVIASTPSVDRYGDIVSAPWQLKRYEANPVVQWAHDYSLPPVGKVLDLSVDPLTGNLMARIQWDDSEANPLGKTVAHQFREGFLSAVSVGFAPTESVPRHSLPDDDPRKADSGNVYTNSELLEISAVPIPANAEALAQRGVFAPDWTITERATEAAEPPPPVERGIDPAKVRDAVLAVLRADDEARAEVTALVLDQWPADGADWLTDDLTTEAQASQTKED